MGGSFLACAPRRRAFTQAPVAAPCSGPQNQPAETAPGSAVRHLR